MSTHYNATLIIFSFILCTNKKTGWDLTPFLSLADKSGTVPNCPEPSPVLLVHIEPNESFVRDHHISVNRVVCSGPMFIGTTLVL